MTSDPTLSTRVTVNSGALSETQLLTVVDANDWLRDSEMRPCDVNSSGNKITIAAENTVPTVSAILDAFERRRRIEVQPPITKISVADNRMATKMVRKSKNQEEIYFSFRLAPARPD